MELSCHAHSIPRWPRDPTLTQRSEMHSCELPSPCRREKMSLPARSFKWMSVSKSITFLFAWLFVRTRREVKRGREGRAAALSSGWQKQASQCMVAVFLSLRNLTRIFVPGRVTWSRLLEPPIKATAQAVKSMFPAKAFVFTLLCMPFKTHRRRGTTANPVTCHQQCSREFSR